MAGNIIHRTGQNKQRTTSFLIKNAKIRYGCEFILFKKPE